ncbi:CoA-binding protein [Streptomyces antimycoticus]|uniref:CoA-binding protein n=1 Tax=Streptomyces antimycoticus TaxID=68175 RepID=UPI003439219C
MTLSATERRVPERDLGPLFSPNAVAIVGASNDQTKWGNWISVQALRMRQRRPVYLINRRGEPVLGERAYRSMAELPQRADLAVVAVPAAGFESAVEDALAAGARAIVGITSGFAELGAEGEARQTALASPSPRWRPCRVTASAADWNWRWPRTSGWPTRTPSSACPRLVSAFCPAPAG